MRRKNPGPQSHSQVEYHQLEPTEDGYVDQQFQRLPSPIPWKAIGLALILFCAGTLLLVIGSLLVTGYIDAKYSDRTWPVIVLGAIMFIPGAYHVRIAYFAYKNYPGYDFDDIPSFS